MTTALQGKTHIVMLTPKRYTGHARQAWQVYNPTWGIAEISPGRGEDETGNKVKMRNILSWLNFGTAAHGPVTAKALFVPISQRAVMMTLQGFRDTGTFSFWAGTKLIRVKGTRGGQMLQYGIDYLWCKRVRGITAMHFVEATREFCRIRGFMNAVGYLKSLIASTGAAGV